eukprot:8341454-Pyramimonas_sp.AAC.1
MRLTHPAQRFALHRELHRRPQGQSPHAFPPPSTTFRGPEGAPPKAPVAKSACVSPTQCSVSWPMGGSTEGPSGTARMRLPHP